MENNSIFQDYQKAREKVREVRRKETKATEKKRMQEELYVDDHELDEAPEQPGCSQATTMSSLVSECHGINWLLYGVTQILHVYENLSCFQLKLH